MTVMNYPPDPKNFSRMNTAEMRATFLVDELFAPGQVRMYYSPVDRAVIGSAVPSGKSLMLEAAKEMASEYFTQRRELGVLNIGGPGEVRVGGQEFQLANKEILYIGRENPEISFLRSDSRNPALFYFVSYPAHTTHPCKKAGKKDADSSALGTEAAANCRTIHRMIHPAGIKSCQLTMGFTELAEGSIWNTMPVHTHARRSEIYLYFDLPNDAMVLHCMGEPQETRHIIVRNGQAIVSPPWSIHSGAGTSNYSFIWAMGGENQEFADMDHVPMSELG